MVQVLDAVHRGGVDPAGAGRRDQHQYRPFEGAGAQQLAQGQTGARFRRFGGAQADVDPDRLTRRSTADGRYGPSRRAGCNELAAGTPQLVPAQQRFATAALER